MCWLLGLGHAGGPHPPRSDDPCPSRLHVLSRNQRHAAIPPISSPIAPSSMMFIENPSSSRDGRTGGGRPTSATAQRASRFTGGFPSDLHPRTPFPSAQVGSYRSAGWCPPSSQSSSLLWLGGSSRARFEQYSALFRPRQRVFLWVPLRSSSQSSFSRTFEAARSRKPNVARSARRELLIRIIRPPPATASPLRSGSAPSRSTLRR